VSWSLGFRVTLVSFTTVKVNGYLGTTGLYDACGHLGPGHWGQGHWGQSHFQSLGSESISSLG
jgi:hypothetical protein